VKSVFYDAYAVDTKAELECARKTVCRLESALIDKEREFCQKLEQARSADWRKIRQLNSEMYRISCSSLWNQLFPLFGLQMQTIVTDVRGVCQSVYLSVTRRG